MVHHGPSTGCSRCRQRHVKCDEAKPACARCISLKAVCPGYGHVTNGVVFKDVSASLRHKYSRRQASNSNVVLAKSAVPVPLSPDPHTACISFLFAAVFGRDRNGTSQGYLEQLVPLYTAAAPSSALALVTLVLAGRAMSLHFRLPQNSPWLYEIQVSASAALRRALADHIASRSNDTLLAVLCLNFAGMLSTKPADTMASRTHLNGAIALVRHRGPTDFTDPLFRSLTAMVRSNALLQYLSTGEEQSRVAFADLPDVDVPEFSPAIQLHQIMANVLQLHLAIAATARDNAYLNERPYPSQFSSRARRLYGRLLHWRNDLPSLWKSILPDRPLVGPQSTYARVNDRFLYHITYIHGQWLCAKIVVLRLLHAARANECTDLPFIDGHSRSIFDLAQGVADDICVLPLLLEDTRDAALRGVSDGGRAVDSSLGLWYFCTVLGWAWKILCDASKARTPFVLRPGTLSSLSDKQLTIRTALGKVNKSSNGSEP